MIKAQVRTVRLGHWHLRSTISRAIDAHSSPRKKAGSACISGWFEKRAEMAQTERTRTGGSAPALHQSLAACESFSKNRPLPLPELPHITGLVEDMVGLSVDIVEKHLGKMLLDVFVGERITAILQELVVF